MTTIQKFAALDNLETQYDEMVSCLTALIHSDRYYTEAECDAKYYSLASKTAGSVCETLDGYSYSELIDLGVPSGAIGIWSGSIESIPEGWGLCDGSNSTPYLVDRFIVGAGDSYGLGDIGGSETCTADATVSIASHILTLAEIPKHTHSLTDYRPTGSSRMRNDYPAPISSSVGLAYRTLNTSSVGGGLGHGHTGSSFAPTVNQDKRPAYYALAFIMKV